MENGYIYHAFISYSRSGVAAEWLHNHFLPVLIDCLTNELPEQPELFVDAQIDVGADWPLNLVDALHHSCYMIALWTPPYFRSTWCVAEWNTMRQRERHLGLHTSANTAGLIYPIVLGDGDSFPLDARRTQQQRDLKQYAYPYRQFRDSQKYLAFHDTVQQIALDFAQLLTCVPTWNPDWKPAEPTVLPPFTPRFSRL